MLKNTTDIIGGIVEVVFAIGEFVVRFAINLFIFAAILTCLCWLLGIGA